jgi:peptidoglycan-N-acetylglucosamine deacetylase
MSPLSTNDNQEISTNKTSGTKTQSRLSVSQKKFSIYITLLLFVTTFFSLISISWVNFSNYIQVTPAKTELASQEVKGAFENNSYTLNNPAFVNLDFDYFSTLKDNYANFDTLIIPTYQLNNKKWIANQSPDYSDLTNVIQIKPIKSNILINFDFGDYTQSSNYINDGQFEFLQQRARELQGVRGINLTLNLSKLSTQEIANLKQLLIDLKTYLNYNKKVLTLTTSYNQLDNEENVKWLQESVDRLYVQVWSTNENKTVELSPNTWSNIIPKLDPTKTSLILPTFQQKQTWTNNSLTKVENISFEEVTKAIKENPNSKITYPNLSPKLDINNQNERVEINFQDATSVYNYRNYINKLTSPKNFSLGISSIGGSEPTSFAQIQKPDLENLKKFKATLRVERNGKGSVVDKFSLAKEGERAVVVEDNKVKNQTITKFSEIATVETSGIDPNKLSITFDDGPDPVYTPQILDVLKQFDAKATFFVIGKRVKENPELIKRIISEGHEIENHSYTHPRFGSKEQLQAEIIYTDKVLKELGVQTKYFRAPFSQFSNNSEKDLDNLASVQETGKLTIHDDYNGYDYIQNATGQQISDKIINQIASKPGSVIVLHDSDGENVKNRSETVEALKIFLPILKSKDYKFVKLSDIHTGQAPVAKIQESDLNNGIYSIKNFENSFETLRNNNPSNWTNSQSGNEESKRYSSLSVFYMILVGTLFSLLIVSFLFGRVFKRILK